MELLNKTELLNKLKYKYNDNWPSEIGEGFQMAIDMIDEQPTVEAIPIEWIKKYRDQFETTDDYYNVVDYMLRLWEKTNELG